MKLTDYEYAIQMAEIARRAAGNTPEGAEHVARLEKIAARLDDARVVERLCHCGMGPITGCPSCGPEVKSNERDPVCPGCGHVYANCSCKFPAEESAPVVPIPNRFARLALELRRDASYSDRVGSDVVTAVFTTRAAMDLAELLDPVIDTARAPKMLTPKGWKVVPITPTPEMLDAFLKGWSRIIWDHKGPVPVALTLRNGYDDMLDAVLNPPVPGGTSSDGGGESSEPKVSRPTDAEPCHCGAPAGMSCNKSDCPQGRASEERAP